MSRAGQLLTAPADPNSFRAFANKNVLTNVCTKLYTAPHGWSFVLTSLTIDAWADPTPGNANNAAIFSGPNCSKAIADWNPATVGDQVLPFGPGFVVPQGKSLWTFVGGGVTAEFYGYGYVVPTADAPASTPVALTVHRQGAARQSQ